MTAYANTVVLLGDSITNVCCSESAEYPHHGDLLARGYWGWAELYMRQRWSILADLGVGGEKSDEILARVDDAIAYAPAYCVVQCGTNDINGGYSAATIEANLTAIYAALTAAGIKVIACEIPPSTVFNTAGRKTICTDVNTWLGVYFAANPTVGVLVEWYDDMVDADAGDPKDDYTHDGTHPSCTGARVMGARMAETIDYLGIPISLLTTDSSSNIITNGLMTGDVSGVATGWTSYAAPGCTATFSKVDRLDGYGKWQQIVSDGGALCYVYKSVASTVGSWVAGDVVQGICDFETNAGFSASEHCMLYMWAYPTVYAAALRWGSAYAEGTGSMPTSGVMRTAPLTIPTGTTSLRFYGAYGTYSGTIRFGRCEIKKITTWPNAMTATTSPGPVKGGKASFQAVTGGKVTIHES